MDWTIQSPYTTTDDDDQRYPAEWWLKFTMNAITEAQLRAPWNPMGFKGALEPDGV